MSASDKVNILVVDDREDKLFAFSSILSTLNQNVICVTSGKEALRFLLKHQAAVILLDVNMPGMDGFETATLIRQRRNLQDIPIIFVTAHDTENSAFRGYSVGAVDYVLAPVSPEVLRTKVGVFVELYKKTRQLQRQAEILQQRASQLQKLMEASLTINSALALERVLQLVTDTARELMGADQAMIKTTLAHIWSKTSSFVSPSHAPAVNDADWYTIYAMVCGDNRAVRMARDQWRDCPLRNRAAAACPAWMAVPLTARNERNIGVLYVCRDNGEDFNEEHEIILVHLAQLASVAIENSINYEAREANKMKDEFLATLSHELRTPLTSMLAWVRLLRDDGLDQATRDKGLEVLDRNVRAQKRLIDDLLDVSRIITGKLALNPKPVDIRALVEATVESLKPAAAMKAVALNAELHPTPRIMADAHRLQQAIGHVINNAIKFTPQGGRVSVRLEVADSRIQITVTDTGKGIAAEHLPIIFEKFRQADNTCTRNEGGLGLGLAIVRHLLDLHGGAVSARSEGLGKGSEFKLTLPIIAVRMDGPVLVHGGGVLSAPAAIDLTGVSVLVVDDEPDSREAVMQVLHSAKAAVQCAPSVQVALEMLAVAQPKILISDIGMPHQDGYELIARVRELERHWETKLPAIALTAYARDEDRARSLAAGFQLHLCKPVEPADLIQAVAMLSGVLRENSAIV